ncbi:LysM peptidoglycan-binding domain-containing protein [Hyphomonas sp.]|uniref:LysM peptidoglycan-binding domain-containing protein n=2 Tax=Hyphomonas sp. TaxID=87 RepID=UPI00329862A2
MTTGTKAITVQSEIWLFEIPFILTGLFEDSSKGKLVRFTVRVGNKTLGEVLRYVLDEVGGPRLALDPPWNAIEKIRLDSFEFVIELRDGVTSYGLVYNQLNIDLGFAQFDKLGVLYSEDAGRALDVNIYGSFLGVDFSKNPISWDALKEQPPQSPAKSDSVFKLDYLGLGQRVTLRDVTQYETIGAVMEALQESYFQPDSEQLNPLQTPGQSALVYDESAAWLVGAKFSVLDTFAFQGLWNLPALAGARIALSGERAKSLAGFEFEILYRKIAEDLGQYHIELVLPDVLRRFQAGAASVALPIIAIEIYTDGGFKIDLGFPENLNFERSFSIELMVGPIPVTGAIGVYFGRLSPKAVPGLPAITGGDFGPVIIAGAGFRIGVGKSIKAGILEAGFFLGIEGLIEGVVGFFEPWENSEPKATYYRVSGTLQLTGHIYGKVDFAIISAAVDIYAYISVSGTFEAYRATVLAFEAGVKVNLTVKINLGLFKVPIELSFSATIREEAVIGTDEQTPWLLEGDVGSTLKERLGPVGYRRLPTGEIVANPVFARMLNRDFDWDKAAAARVQDLMPSMLAAPSEPEELKLYFRPITSLALKGDRPGETPDPALGEANLVAALMLRTSRESEESFSPAEKFSELVLRFGLSKWREKAWLAGAEFNDDVVSLSELTWLKDHLEGADPPIVITPGDVEEFFRKWAAPVIELAPWTDTGPALTPFPMIPLMTVSAGVEETESYRFDFENGPLCSEAYQADIREYFQNLDPMRDSQGTPVDAVVSDEGDPLSMAQLIFIDCFKLTLRKVVADAVEQLTLANLVAGGRSIQKIAEDCGINHPAGIARIIEANLENAQLFTEGAAIAIARDGVPLASAPNLVRLGKAANIVPLAAARSIFRQPLISETAKLKMHGVRHLILVNDTKQSILDQYFLSNWQESEDANPVMDWSVPKATSDPNYPTLSLPAGSWIDIPEFMLPPAADRSIADLSDTYAQSPADIIWKPASIVFDTGRLAQIGLTTLVGEGETIAVIAAKFGQTSEALIDASLLYDPAVLSPGRALSVSAGKYLIARDDTLPSIAAAHQTTPEAIKKANEAEPWRLMPRPDSIEKLPMGVEIALPAVGHFVPRLGDTFVAIAQLFGIDAAALALANAETLVLTTGAAVYLPQFSTTTAAATSPANVAKSFAVTPSGILRANQGTLSGWGEPAPLASVVVPHCEEMAESELIDRLANGDKGSQLNGAAQAQSRFLLAGLRLPDPSDPARASDPETDKPLWPLYTLSGQQWPAPATPSETYWVKLNWNASEPAQIMAKAVHDEAVDPESAYLTTDDIALINQFRALGADPAKLEPNLLAQHPYPAYQQVTVAKTFGAAIQWTIPDAVGFGAPPPNETVIQPLLLDVPINIRSALPSELKERAPLELSEVSPDPISGKPLRRILTNTGWATAIELRIRQSFGSEDNGAPLKATYEAISIAAQGQADLEGLRSYIHDHHGDNPIDIYLLYSTDPLSASPDGLNSDAMSAEARAKIALLKANLSTFSNPAGSFSQVALFEGGAEVASATLTEGERFLDLLWQISVTNGGGFFLNYPDGPDGPGLPENLFEAGDTATITLLVALRVGDPLNNPYLPTIPPAKFHNTLITAENLTSAKATVEVQATTKPVGYVEGSDPQLTQSLEQIAGSMLTLDEIVQLNQSNHTILHQGAVITPLEGDPYTIKPGDDLLGVSQAMALDITQLTALVGTQTDLLEYGAMLAMRPGWVTGKSRVEPEQGGFEIIRSQPQPTPATADITPEEAVYRLQAMFQMMGYALDGDDVFSLSNHGLAIMPDEPDNTDPLARFGMDGDALQPWVYRRLLPIAPFAKEGPFDHIDSLDPYGGLGKAARVSFGFQDIFGNRLPVAGDGKAISWKQLYRDPLIPLHAWPSVSLAYDVADSRQQSSPQIRIRVKFAPAGYVAEIGGSAGRLRNKAKADQKRFALAYYQVASQRVNAEVFTTLTKGVYTPLDTKRMAVFAKDAFDYLEAIQKLEPQFEEATEDSTLKMLAVGAQVTVDQITVHIANQPCLLRAGASVMLPERFTVMPNTSLAGISERMNGHPDPATIGILNETAALTPGLLLELNKSDYVTKTGDTLKKIAPDNRTVAQIAKENEAVKGLFPESTELFLGLLETTIEECDTLAKIAARNAVRLEDIASINAGHPFFAEGAQIELPLQLAIPAGIAMSAAIASGQPLSVFVKAHEGSVRDILTANSATTGLLKKGAKIAYSTSTMNDEVFETVTQNDTWATIALKMGARIGDPSLKPADVGAYPANADNTALYVDDALMLLPPIRFGKDVDVPHSASTAVITDRLGVEIRVNRNDETLIDPAFRNLAEVQSVTSTVPARLSSEFTRAQRGTLLAFARQFQDTFDNLKLCVGPDTFTSVSSRALLSKSDDPESKLIAVNWSAKGFGAEVSGPPRFFAPRPLMRQPWNKNGVSILPYISGAPLDPAAAVETNFNNADLERWAMALLTKIDRILYPDLAAPLRALSPTQYEAITAAKAAIAKAVSGSIDQILDPQTTDNPPDHASAAEQLEQQLLVELAKTYRGGVVAQFVVSATTPAGENWTPETAPRLLCSASPVLYKIPDDEPTFDELAKHFGTKPALIGVLLQNVENLLEPGFKIPVGTQPVVAVGETIAHVAGKAEITIEKLIAAVQDTRGFLRPGAEIPLARNVTKTAVDETLGSALERLAPNLTSGNLLDFSISIFVQMNGTTKGVFEPDISLEWKDKETYTTTGDECFDDLVAWFKETDAAVFRHFLVEAPLLKPGTEFAFLARLPPVTASASKITLCSDPAYVNKLNTVLVNSMPDQASSLPLQLAFQVQAMEYNIHDVADGGDYQASEWLTFVDHKFGQIPDAFDLPVPNRQFPIPPQVLDHGVAPRVADSKVDPAKIEDALFYDYRLRFAFDASAQDEISYTRYEPGAFDTQAQDEDEPVGVEALAETLAQFTAIEEALFEDILIMRTWNGRPGGDAEAKIALNAVEIFAAIATKAGAQWQNLGEDAAPTVSGESFRIRRHNHPSGHSLLTVTPHRDAEAYGMSTGGRIPEASIIGRETSAMKTDSFTATMMSAKHASLVDIDADSIEEAGAVPVPRTRLGEFYQVDDKHLNLLNYQQCWGGISILRNRRLVEGIPTADPFLLHVPDVRTTSYLTPTFIYAQRINLGTEIGPLADRLKTIFERIFFPTESGVVPPRQRVSATMAFTRPSATAAGCEEVDPADWKSMFVPVSTTPLIELDQAGTDGLPTPKVAADTIAAHLTEFLSGYDLSPNENWSFTLKLFSHLNDKDTPPQLLEIIDIRVRMSDQ